MKRLSSLAQFQQFYPQVRDFYDFERFELLGAYADGDRVFARISVRLAGSPHSILLAEEFRFAGTRLVEVRVYLCDPPGALSTRAAARSD